ncbi:YbjN domain-containing protein [Mannheimia pernigra]|uniref:YbjN domain-containing protein n=1 Tax=Mannheimia pernigra TaxID=111844 RepID=A0A7D5IDA6_9PAST|nr:YbjN domain-containing protein [Mannheimia pernigra]QLB39815.1 YbjN domain-containing protein [Mannheimia pernigra]
MANQLQPLNKARLIDRLNQQKWCNFQGENDIYLETEQGGLFFSLTGEQDEILTVRGIWRTQLKVDRLVDALSFCNEHNHSCLFPKAYVVLHAGEEYFSIHSEIAMDYEHGISDTQLDHYLNMAVSCSFDFFDELDDTYGK